MQGSLDQVMKGINKKFKDSELVIKLTDSPVKRPEDVISSGCIALDSALGIGGYLKGRIVELYGKDASGKTTTGLHAIAEAQKAGGRAGLIDLEHALDLDYAERIGVDPDNLLFTQPNYGEQALDVLEMMIRSHSLDIIVLDSVAAIVPKAELEGDAGQSLPGLQARLMSQAMRKLTSLISNSNCVVIFINQIRTNIGVMYGDPNVTCGGNAIKFYASMRLQIQRIGSIKDNNDKIIANKTRVKVVKNKLAAPFKQAEFDIRFGIGIDKAAELLDLGSEDGIIMKAGAWYSLDGERIGQGRPKALQTIRDNPEVLDRIRTEVLKNRGLI